MSELISELDAVGLHTPVEPVDATHGILLYLEEVSVSFDGFKAIDKLSLYIGDGELRCIIGPNGAGKTTMMDIITGILAKAVTALAEQDINVNAMHQSMRQVDMQFVIDEQDYEGAIRSLHRCMVEVHDHGRAICLA